MFRAVTEKFFIEYHQDLSAIPPLANTLVQFCCHSLSNQNPEHYVFSKVAMSFFANHGYDTEGFTINPYMVVNKVFSSYYKHVQFPIVTFDELKREIQL